MNEGRHYSNEVEDKMYQLQLVVVQQAAEEVPHREVESVLEEGREDNLLLEVFGKELLPSRGLPLHLCLWPEQPAVHKSLDLGLRHRRPDPRRLRVRDASRLLRHFAARVCTGSNSAQSFDAHAQRSATRSGGASAWPARAGDWMGACARERGSCKIAGKLLRRK
jgi:hypothetical protein